MIILRIKTNHTGPFRTIIEVLKDLIPETNIEFRIDPKNLTKSLEADDDEEYSEEFDSDEEIINDDDSSDDDTEEDGEDKKKEEKKSKSGMRIMAIDNSKCALVNLKLDAKNFSKFICKKEKISLGINLGVFHTLIKSVDKDDTMELYQNNDDNQNLNIKIRNPGDKTVKTDYKIKLMDIDESKIPDKFDMKFDGVITINSNYFHKLCREMKSIAEFVEITCLNDKLILTCKGEQAERKETLIVGSDDKNRKINIQRPPGAKGPVHGVYELKNLVMFSKCGNLCNEIILYMKNDYLLAIKYTIANLGRLLLLLVPVDEETANGNYSDEDVYYSDNELEIIN